MEKKTISPALSYGLSHSKQYKPSSVAKFLCDCDKATGKLIKRHTDVYLLLRQQKLVEKIGADSIRGYLDQQRAMHGESLIPHGDLSDDELFALIEPKSVNNLTTAHEFAKYLKANREVVIDKHKQLVREKQSREKWYELFGDRKKDDNKKDG